MTMGLCTICRNLDREEWDCTGPTDRFLSCGPSLSMVLINSIVKSQLKSFFVLLGVLCCQDDSGPSAPWRSESDRQRAGTLHSVYLNLRSPQCININTGQTCVEQRH
ncbi:hypothetical protein JZ751_027185 [Albula glossodonta]|uniref:Uncharacterized protein n=1 Tax=Albula glossodonta TaxID=121402 RepID=A0A8T2NK42_9TELE|nr:hypothetical protein JZ751_027185 [Albula glossodonta]